MLKAAILLAAGLSAAANPDAADVIARLDADSYAERSAAQRELVEKASRDAAVLEAVRAAATDHESAEVRARCEAVASAAERGRLLGATVITVSVENASQEELLKAVGEAADVAFEVVPSGVQNRTARYDLSLDNVPLLVALAELEKITNLKPAMTGITPGPDAENRPVVQLADNVHMGAAHGLADGVTTHWGAFAVTAAGVSSNDQYVAKFLNHPENPAGMVAQEVQRHRSVSLEVRLLAEPKLSLTGGVSGPIVEEVTDGEGNPLDHAHVAHVGRGRGMAFPVQRQSGGLMFVSNLFLGEGPATDKLSFLKGYFEVEVPTKTSRWEAELSDLSGLFGRPGGGNNWMQRLRRAAAGEGIGEAAGRVLPRPAGMEVETPQTVQIDKDLDVPGRNVRLISMTRSSQWHVQLQLHATLDDVSAAGDWHRLQQTFAGLTLVDADGRAWQSHPSGAHFDGTRVVGNLTFSRQHRPHGMSAGEPAKLVWTLTEQSEMVRVPFEFRDVPMPPRH